jgi:glycosyltransferase involved in cell wall biosynthesis
MGRSRQRDCTSTGKAGIVINMRIILATESYFPHVSGVTVSVHTLAKALVARGHAVCIFAPSATGSRKTEFRDGVEVQRFPSVPNPLKPKTRISLRMFSPMIVDALQAFKPDIVHVHGATGVPAAVVVAARREFIPVVATQHFQISLILAYLKFIDLAEPLTRTALVAYLNSFYQKCDRLTVPSESMRRLLQDEGIKKHVEVISNGVDLRTFAPPKPTAKRRLPANRPIVLHVGRIDQEKNIPTLLEAIPEVVAAIPSVLFAIVGTGKELGSAKRWVAKMGLTYNVQFLGKIAQGSAQLNELYHQSDLFVIPSNIEAQGIVVLEAMACGLPIVASKSGALPELVRHAETGYAAMPNHPEEFAKWIITLLENPEERKAMGLAARERVKKHDLVQVVDEIEQLYRSLLPAL